jgi:NarL family two-component system response regulator LiaR
MSQTEGIRILLVDDHMMVRVGIKSALDSFDDLVLVGEAENGAVALTMCETTKPDVILMDLVMPEMDGVTATKKVSQKYPHVQVIALTSYGEKHLVKDALEAGAISFMYKDILLAELVDAIRQAYAGKAMLSSGATQALMGLVAKQDEPGSNLTPREREVLALMIAGFPNPKIAEELNISLNTVKSHVSNILTKLNASTRTEAVSIAIKNGYNP